ncbi:hypothetical protein FV242_21510 [Methylobacterium sp. WL64]|uniref:hypothetical protein n=1 Tax=Methylobacterium sp. WL64 TaxID=2603894 RepID=UPI0011C7EF20|nr:hypothetical protein [Methylobacterium sp. WL64]TXN00573.1 hypothetical protein FV242_21510 [Methylobacterium sp. WL64]
MNVRPAGMHDNAGRWLPYLPVLRDQALDLYGAEPLLCVAILGMPLGEYLARIQALEVACQRAETAKAAAEAAA